MFPRIGAVCEGAEIAVNDNRWSATSPCLWEKWDSANTAYPLNEFSERPKVELLFGGMMRDPVSSTNPHPSKIAKGGPPEDGFFLRRHLQRDRSKERSGHPRPV
jgi:hypothetical protein